MKISHIIGLDDAPFDRDSRDPVMVVGAVCAGSRLHGVISLSVTRDGSDAALNLIEAVRDSKFSEHIQLIMLQGVAFAGFNVVDVFAVHEELGLPVLVVSRKEPDRERIRRVLLESVHDGSSKWEILERLGKMEPVRDVWVQRVGLTREETVDVLETSVVEGNLPEPIRLAHLIAGGVVRGESRSRP